MSSQLRARILVISLLALILVSPVNVRFWVYQSEAFIPARWIQRLTLNKLSMQADFDQDGQKECLKLNGGQTFLTKSSILRNSCGSVANDLLLWQSPVQWYIKQAEITDLNRDGHFEITLLVWRKFLPWPIDKDNPGNSRIKDFHNAAGLSCHLILIGWKQGKYREVWAGSALAEPLDAFSSADINQDGYEELIATEHNYDDPFWKPATSLSAWEWNGFGFTRLTRINGIYNQLYTMTSPEKMMYVVTQ